MQRLNIKRIVLLVSSVMLLLVGGTFVNVQFSEDQDPVMSEFNADYSSNCNSDPFFSLMSVAKAETSPESGLACSMVGDCTGASCDGGGYGTPNCSITCDSGATISCAKEDDELQEG